MLGAPRPAGSALPTHALSCLQALQSRRRCLPAEPGLSFSTAVNVVRGVQTDPKWRIWREPCNRGVPYSHISDTTGRFWPVSMIHVHTHFGEAPTLDPASKLIKRRRSWETRPVLVSPHHMRCLLSLRRSAAVIPGSTLTASLLGASRWQLWGLSPRVSRRVAETLYLCGLNLHIIE